MTTTTMPAREDLESRALSQLTDEQAMATWERFKAGQKAYVAAIIEKVPA